MNRTRDLNPARLSAAYVNEVRQQLTQLGQKPRIVGLIATQDEPSLAYARATQHKFEDVGIEYELRHVKRLELEQHINEANNNTSIHGIFIYFPVFNSQQDDYLRNQVDYTKDIEAGSRYWTRKLYANDRSAAADRPDDKAVLPCTPLAIVKLLTEIGVYRDELKPIAGMKVSIFNRSEVIGRPLAVMLSNDGGHVYSFDEFGPLEFINAIASETDITRREALAQSDIVITGVPSPAFPKISASEVRENTVCINFSSVPNFEDDINTHTDTYIPRIGPMTVAMCMRNTLRLYTIFHTRP